MRRLHVLGALSALAMVAIGPATAAPVPEVGAGTTLTVSDEAEYRAALLTLSAMTMGFHTIALAADIVIDDGTDPTYTGTQSLTIEGHGFVMDATGSSRILDFQGDAHLRVQEVTIVGGSAAGDGGAILAMGDVEVDDSTFDGNVASGDGGAIEAAGILSIAHSTINANTAGGDGGGVDTFSADGTLIVEQSTFTGNSAVLDAGAMEGENGLGMVNSTVFGNEGGNGIVNAETGGTGIHSTTIAGNTSSTGGAVASEDSGSLLISLSVLDGNSTGCSGFGTVSSTYSYATDASCGLTGTGDVESGPSPGLAAPADNGGPTETMLPDLHGPLVDAVPVPVCRPLNDLDQRDELRPSDGLPGGSAGCDIGAVEVQSDMAPPPVVPPGVGPDDEGPVAATPAFTG